MTYVTAAIAAKAMASVFSPDTLRSTMYLSIARLNRYGGIRPTAVLASMVSPSIRAFTLSFHVNWRSRLASSPSVTCLS
ncbi:hypothetical protein ES703_53427 [subsurface metagenome]